MKASVIAASLLGALVSGLAVPGVSPRAELEGPFLFLDIYPNSTNPAASKPAIGRVFKAPGSSDITQFMVSMNVLAPGDYIIKFSDPLSVSGSQSMQIFLAQAEGGTVHRDIYSCTIKAKPPGLGFAEPQEGETCLFTVRVPGKQLFEAVPAGDNSEISWEFGINGAFKIVGPS